MRYLNIEVVLGLVALAQTAAWTLQTELPPLWYVVVPLATWALYTLDRIIDAQHPSGVPDTGRHAFHVKHRSRLFGAACGAIALAAVVAVTAFPFRYWLAAAVLGGATLSHLLLQRSRSRRMAILKDVNVAITYTLAAWAIPLVDANAVALVASWLPLLLITVTLVTIDVIHLSRLDAVEDAQHDRPSIAVVLGEPRSQRVADVLAIGSGLGAAWWMLTTNQVSLGVCLILMSLAYLYLGHQRGAAPDRMRLYLELVLAMPLFVVLGQAWPLL